jgi:tetratricopeptide (TPR) repeat protein
MAIKDADLFNKNYGSQKPAQTAFIAFAIGAHYIDREDWDQARKRLTTAMSQIDRNATFDVQIQAHAMLARVYMKVRNPSSATPEYNKVRGYWKDPGAAIKKLDAIGGDDGEKLRRLGKVLTAIGEAYFFFAEVKRRDVDKIKFPTYKGKGERDEVIKHVKTKVKEWIDKKRPAIEEAEKEYLKVVKLEPVPPPKWVIASGSRVGKMWGDFVVEFRSAPIPIEWKGNGNVPGTDLSYAELRGTYYQSLDEASEPQKQQAKGAFKTCLEYSVKYQYFDEFSRSCEVWLSKNYGAEFHLIDEFRGSPSRVNSALSDKPFPLNLDGTPFRPDEPPPADKPSDKKDEKAAADAPSDPSVSPEKAALQKATTKKK